MTSIEARLKQMKKYRKEALLSPEENKLYIEDLNLSIKLFESQVRNGVIINEGWLDSEEVHANV
jgi:hypothetical protein